VDSSFRQKTHGLFQNLAIVGKFVNDKIGAYIPQNAIGISSLREFVFLIGHGIVGSAHFVYF